MSHNFGGNQVKSPQRKVVINSGHIKDAGFPRRVRHCSDFRSGSFPIPRSFQIRQRRAWVTGAWTIKKKKARIGMFLNTAPNRRLSWRPSTTTASGEAIPRGIPSGAADRAPHSSRASAVAPLSSACSVAASQPAVCMRLRALRRRRRRRTTRDGLVRKCGARVSERVRRAVHVVASASDGEVLEPAAAAAVHRIGVGPLCPSRRRRLRRRPRRRRCARSSACRRR